MVIFRERGRYTVKLVIDHQSFAIARGFSTKFNLKQANFYARQLAIALNRFKYGD